MKGKSIQNICIISFLVLGTTVTLADAAVLNVDANGGGDYSSIQEAVDKAQNGDTILVSPGVYQENVKVNKELIIASDSAPTGDQINRTYIVGLGSG